MVTSGVTSNYFTCNLFQEISYISHIQDILHSLYILFNKNKGKFKDFLYM